ncbi:hypothetical protein MASR2M39_12320 [Ignavibacteriales bacterium]
MAVGNAAGLIDINSDGGSFSGMVKGQVISEQELGDENKTTSSFYIKTELPKPFNPQPKLDLPSQTSQVTFHLLLAVYDVVGNEVALLVNEEKAPGDHHNFLFSKPPEAFIFTEWKRQDLHRLRNWFC